MGLLLGWCLGPTGLLMRPYLRWPQNNSRLSEC